RPAAVAGATRDRHGVGGRLDRRLRGADVSADRAATPLRAGTGAATGADRRGRPGGRLGLAAPHARPEPAAGARLPAVRAGRGAVRLEPAALRDHRHPRRPAARRDAARPAADPAAGRHSREHANRRPLLAMPRPNPEWRWPLLVALATLLLVE